MACPSFPLLDTSLALAVADDGKDREERDRGGECWIMVLLTANLYGCVGGTDEEEEEEEAVVVVVVVVVVAAMSDLRIEFCC